MMKSVWLLMVLSSVSCLCLGVFLGFKWKVAGLVDEISGEKAKRQIKVLHDIHSGKSTLEDASTTDVSEVSSGTIITNGVQGVNTEVIDNIDADKVSTKDLLEDLDYRNDGYNKDFKYDSDEDEPTGTLDTSIALEEDDDDEPTGTLEGIDDVDEPTGILGTESVSDYTSYAGGDEDVATSYLDGDLEGSLEELQISIIEEQSSL